MPKVDDYALSAFQAIGQSTPKTLRERYLFRSPTLPTPVSSSPPIPGSVELSSRRLTLGQGSTRLLGANWQ